MIYLMLLWTFFRIGIVGFGGGYVIIPLLKSEIELNQWLTAEEFADIVAVSQMTPGPIGINAATFIGIRTAGILGGITATVGMVLPSLILVVIVAHMIQKFKESTIVQSVLQGIRPAVIGLIAYAVVFFASMSVYSETVTNINFRGAAIFVIILALTLKWKIHPILAIFTSAALGVLLYLV